MPVNTSGMENMHKENCIQFWDSRSAKLYIKPSSQTALPLQSSRWQLSTRTRSNFYTSWGERNTAVTTYFGEIGFFTKMEPFSIIQIVTNSYNSSLNSFKDIWNWKYVVSQGGERGGSVVECRTPEREVRGSRPTSAVCPWARHFTPRKYWLITQEAMAPSRHDWKIVDWDVKPQHNQPTKYLRDHIF